MYLKHTISIALSFLMLGTACYGGGPQTPAWAPEGVLSPPAEEPWLTRGKYMEPEEGKAILDAFLEHHPDRASWEAYARDARENIQSGAQLKPYPKRTPLTPRITERREYDGYSVENVMFQSLPGYWVTGNLYRPLDAEAPYAAVLHTHGHSSGIENPEDWIHHGRFKEDVQMRAAALARMGAVSLTLDMVGYGDSLQVLGKESHRNPLSLTLHIWNAMRALDFLEDLESVDSTRLGVTGHSGGGTQAFLLAALDNRVKVNVPVAMVSSWFFGGCDCESGLPIHAGDGYFGNNAMITALTAPRPLLVVSDGGDWTTHVPEIEFPFLKSIYEYYDATGHLQNVHLPEEGHNYGISKREAMYPFMARHLDLDLSAIMTVAETIDESMLTVEDPALMRNFKTESDIPDNALRTLDALQARLKTLQ